MGRFGRAQRSRRETCTISPASRDPLPLRSGKNSSIWTLAESHDDRIAERSTPRQGGRRNCATVLFCLSSRWVGAKGEESSRACSKGEETSSFFGRSHEYARAQFSFSAAICCTRSVFSLPRATLQWSSAIAPCVIERV